MKIEEIKKIFKKSIDDYHRKDSVDSQMTNPYEPDTFEFLLYKKNWVDTVQWHLEDIIRNPGINPEEALLIKRRIDDSNQIRTDLVELIDDFYLNKFKNVIINPKATINTESPAWAIDRLSILELKIYHMKLETERKDVSKEHYEKCFNKLEILKMQNQDLSTAIENLLEDISKGLKYMKVYKQMKMYNDPNLNPILYGNK